MAEYHVGCGAFAIYAGTLNKGGNMWTRKSEVTDEVLGASAYWLLVHESEFRFDYKGGKYALKVVRTDG